MRLGPYEIVSALGAGPSQRPDANRRSRVEAGFVWQMTPTRARLLAAFAILPPIQALVAYSAFPVVWYIGGHGDARPTDQAQTARAFALLTGLLGVLVTVAGAIPVVFWLMKRGRLSVGQLLVAGVALGNTPFAFYVLCLILPATMAHLAAGTMSDHILPASELLLGGLRAILIGSTFGALSAAIVWVVGVSRANAS